MSSLASVIPNVTYHLPKQNNSTFRRAESVSTASEISNCDFVMKSVSEVNACTVVTNSNYVSTGVDRSTLNCNSKLVSSNINNALRTSLKFVSNTDSVSYYDTGNDFNKLLNRSISFQNSTAPPLDSLIKQRIQTLPKSLILTNVNEENKQDISNESVLCTDNELACWCRQGPQFVPQQAMGLINSGNTCYLNSVLQCILASGPLLAYISAKHCNQNLCAINTGKTYSPSLNKSRFCGLCGLFKLLGDHKRARIDSNRSNSFTCGQMVPSYFVTNVRAICPSLRPYQQEDAHEFLLGMLSRMEDSSMAHLGKISRKLSGTNIIRRIFGGVMRSEVTCHSCHKVSARDEQWFNLSMDITCARSLQQCLYNYIRSEQLSGVNAYRCENCQQLRSAMRKCTVFRAPPILVIQFNRFSRNQKLDYRVEYPSSFNLRPFMTQSKGQPVLYRLYAIVNHDGYSCRSGHYVSFTRRHGQWLSHNDSFVSTTSLDHILRQSPYLLFYELVQSNLNITSNSSVPLNVDGSQQSANVQNCNAIGLSRVTCSPTVSATPLISHQLKVNSNVQHVNKDNNSSSLHTCTMKKSNVHLINGISKHLSTMTTTTTAKFAFGSTKIATSSTTIPKIVLNPKISVTNLVVIPPVSSNSIRPTCNSSQTADNDTGQSRAGVAKYVVSNVRTNSLNSIHDEKPSTKVLVQHADSSSKVTVQQLLSGANSDPQSWSEHANPNKDYDDRSNCMLPKIDGQHCEPLPNVSKGLVDYSSNEASDSSLDDDGTCKRSKRPHISNGSGNSSDSSVVWVPATSAKPPTHCCLDDHNKRSRKHHKKHKTRHHERRDKHKSRLESGDSSRRHDKHRRRRRDRQHKPTDCSHSSKSVSSGYDYV